jgi:hypothetical protein
MSTQSTGFAALIPSNGLKGKSKRSSMFFAKMNLAYILLNIGRTELKVWGNTVSNYPCRKA